MRIPGKYKVAVSVELGLAEKVLVAFYIDPEVGELALVLLCFQGLVEERAGCVEFPSNNSTKGVCPVPLTAKKTSACLCNFFVKYCQNARGM